MDIEQLEQAGRLLYGDLWQANLARNLNNKKGKPMGARAVRYWVSGERKIPDDIKPQVVRLLINSRDSINKFLKTLEYDMSSLNGTAIGTEYSPDYSEEFPSTTDMFPIYYDKKNGFVYGGYGMIASIGDNPNPAILNKITDGILLDSNKKQYEYIGHYPSINNLVNTERDYTIAPRTSYQIEYGFARGYDKKLFPIQSKV